MAGSSTNDVQAYGFAPIVGRKPIALVLGSMPSRDSLRIGHYYAHTRNAFWSIMGALFGAGPELDYSKRYRLLKRRRIALWDVVQQCQRHGSLDSAIIETSIIVNDIAAVLDRHPSIRYVFFNGAKAEQTCRRHLSAVVNNDRIVLCRLPSTSPAYAALSFDRKLEAWHRLALAVADS